MAALFHRALSDCPLCSPHKLRVDPEFVGLLEFFSGRCDSHANSVCYIAGFVVRKLLHVVQCDACRYSLVCHSSQRQHASDKLCLLHLKPHGGLIVASDNVCQVIKVCEATLHSSVDTQALTHCLRSVTHLELQCMSELVSIAVFNNLNDNALDTKAAEDVYHLKRLIIKHNTTCACEDAMHFISFPGKHSILSEDMSW